MTETSAHLDKNLKRRALVKGGIWTVPVIAAAVAAPAATASTGTVVVAFAPSTPGHSWADMDGGSSTTVLGTGPSSFHVDNSGAAIHGSITGTITIAPNGSVALSGKPKGLGVAAITNVDVTNREVIPSSKDSMADTTRITFHYTGGVPSSGPVTFGITFGYTSGGSFLSLGLLQSYTATLVLRHSNGLQIGQTATSTLSSLLSVPL